MRLFLLLSIVCCALIYYRKVKMKIDQISEKDLLVSPAGVRAQAVKPNGILVDDF